MILVKIQSHNRSRHVQRQATTQPKHPQATTGNHSTEAATGNHRQPLNPSSHRQRQATTQPKQPQATNQPPQLLQLTFLSVTEGRGSLSNIPC